MNITSLIVVLSALTLRLIPRILWKNFNGTDSYFHFFLTNVIKNNKHSIPEKELRVLGGSNFYTYPYFYHWLLSFFPERFLVFWDKFSGSIFDIITGGFLAWAFSHLAWMKGDEPYLFFSAYILSPGLTFSFIGPRPFSLTPRNFSQFIFAISFTLLILSLSTPTINITWVLWFVLSAFFFAVLLLSSQFGLQVLVALLLSGFVNFYIPLCIILGFCIGMGLSKGFLLVQIKAQIRHLEWYFRYNYAFVQHKSNFSAIYSHVKTMNIRAIFYELVFFNQLTSTVIKHTTYFVAIVLGTIYWTNDLLDFPQTFILSICLSVFVPFVLTNFGKMRVFGEAERYIEYVFPLQNFLFFSLISSSMIYITIYLLLGYNLIFYLYNLYQIKCQCRSQYKYEQLQNRVTNAHTLLCLSNNESYIFLRNTNVKIVGFLVNITLEGLFDNFFKRFFVQYPMVNPKEIKYLCEKFKITHILKNKHHQFLAEYNDEIKKLGNYFPSYEDDKYVLYEIKINN